MIILSSSHCLGYNYCCKRCALYESGSWRGNKLFTKTLSLNHLFCHMTGAFLEQWKTQHYSDVYWTLEIPFNGESVHASVGDDHEHAFEMGKPASSEAEPKQHQPSLCAASVVGRWHKLLALFRVTSGLGTVVACKWYESVSSSFRVVLVVPCFCALWQKLQLILITSYPD